MKVTLLGETWSVNNDMHEIDLIFERLNQLATEDDCLLTHMIVDGEEVLENHHQYLANSLSTLKEIGIYVRHFKEMVEETLLSTMEYLERVIPAIRELTNEFYGIPTAVSWAELEQVIEGLQWLNHISEALQRRNQEEYSPFIALIDSVNNISAELEGALQDRDHVLIADILSYEILQKLTSMKHEVRKIVNNEVATHDIN
jgi:hypothetical protein